LLRQDSLFLGLGSGGKEAVAEELECRQSVGFTDSHTYGRRSADGDPRRSRIRGGDTVRRHLRSQSSECLQSLKDLLIENGMQVFESTEMDRLEVIPPIHMPAA
jgi:gamma-glutamylputrescine oxidase